MIYLDDDKFPVDSTLDGGDSSMRMGMLLLCGQTTACNVRLYEHELDSGILRRHPSQDPWSNPWNFTRDQLVPITAGLHRLGMESFCQRIFYAHAKRFFFCQNFERDYAGSKKFPWPHTFINDRGEPETRKFDFADVLMPDHIWHLILCARLWYLYPFAIIGIPWFILSLYFHSISSHKEHNQIICQAKVNGKWAVKMFKFLVKDWRVDLWEYWADRNEREYAKLIIDDLEKI